MKIALLSYEYPKETGFGGIGTYTWYHARALVKLGHNVDVIAGAISPSPLRCEEHDGVNVYRYRCGSAAVKLFSSIIAFGRLWWTKNRFENAISMYLAIRELSKSRHYDIIEMPECGAEGLLVNRFIKGLKVVRFHSPSRLIMQFYDVHKIDITFCSYLEQFALAGTNHYTSCSSFLAHQVTQEMSVKQPVEVIGNGIDLDHFDSADRIDIRKKFSIPEEQLIIFFSGRMEKRKGIHLCKEITKKILQRHEVAFVFAGQDLFDYMLEEILPYFQNTPTKGSIHYLGKLDHTEVRSCLDQADIFLIPSLWENCPYSCLEAMAAGTTVVSSDQGGMPELISHNQNGLLASTGDPHSFIVCLDRLITNPDLRNKFGKAGRKTIEKYFSDTHTAQKTVEYYQSILDCNIQ